MRDTKYVPDWFVPVVLCLTTAILALPIVMAPKIDLFNVLGLILMANLSGAKFQQLFAIREIEHLKRVHRILIERAAKNDQSL